MDNRELVIKDVYEHLEKSLCEEILNSIKFSEVDSLGKCGNEIARGRVYGRSKNKIWSKAWCFYEIGIGYYSAKSSSIGGVGFISFSENKQCGGGLLTEEIRTIIGDFSGARQDFDPSDFNSKHVGTMKYYTFPDTQNLTQLIKEDLTHLIEDTFIKLDALKAI